MKKKQLVSKKSRNIAYQNKDVTAKVFAEIFPKTTLKVYGIDTPRIVRLLPTNLPRIKANELRIDNLFLLEDDSLALLDYESTYCEEHKIKYMEYIVRVLHRYGKQPKKIHMIVIYTADIEEHQTMAALDTGAVKITLEQAFLSKLDSIEIQDRLTYKVKHRLKLSDDELMEFIILPLTFKGMAKKREVIRELFDIAKSIEEEEIQVFLLSGIIAFADKVIDTDVANKMKGWIGMTKVARLFEIEKLEAVKEAKLEGAVITAKNLLKEGIPAEQIARCVPGIGLEEIQKMQDEINVCV